MDGKKIQNPSTRAKNVMMRRNMKSFLSKLASNVNTQNGVAGLDPALRYSINLFHLF